LVDDGMGPAEHQHLGVFVQDVAGATLFDDSTGPVQSVAVTGNEAGGVLIGDGGTTATFTNGTYSSNKGDGINLASFSGAVTLTGVTVNGNSGNGLTLTGAG